MSTKYILHHYQLLLNVQISLLESFLNVKKNIKHAERDCPKPLLLGREKNCLMQWRSKSVDVNQQSLYIGPKLRAAVCRLSSGDSPETVCIYFTEPYLSYPELLPCRGKKKKDHIRAKMTEEPNKPFQTYYLGSTQ